MKKNDIPKLLKILDQLQDMSNDESDKEQVNDAKAILKKSLDARGLVLDKDNIEPFTIGISIGRSYEGVKFDMYQDEDLVKKNKTLERALEKGDIDFKAALQDIRKEVLGDAYKEPTSNCICGMCDDEDED